MIFTRDDVALVRAGKLTAKLYPASTRIRPDRTTFLRRRSRRHDADGNELDQYITAVVTDPNPDGEPKPVFLTITSVDQLHLDELKLADAAACGYRTVTALKDAWNAQHPRTPNVKLVRFVVGDIRDRDRFLSRPSRTGGDYTASRHRGIDDLAALTADQLAPITKHARELDRKRAADPIQRERDSIVDSLNEIEDQLQRNPNRDVSRTIRVLRHHLASLDRKLKAA